MASGLPCAQVRGMTCFDETEWNREIGGGSCFCGTPRSQSGPALRKLAQKRTTFLPKENLGEAQAIRDLSSPQRGG